MIHKCWQKFRPIGVFPEEAGSAAHFSPSEKGGGLS